MCSKIFGGCLQDYWWVCVSSRFLGPDRPLRHTFERLRAPPVLGSPFGPTPLSGPHPFGPPPGPHPFGPTPLSGPTLRAAPPKKTWPNAAHVFSTLGVWVLPVLSVSGLPHFGPVGPIPSAWSDNATHSSLNSLSQAWQTALCHVSKQYVPTVVGCRWFRDAFLG